MHIESQSIPLTTMNGFSRLVKAFTAEEEFCRERFPSNENVIKREYCESTAHRVTTGQRQKIVAAIRDTMSFLQLSPKQESHLKLLLQDNATTIISGQQPVIAGGALYCALKAMSALHHAKHINTLHNDIPVIPIYWVEDNDHDLEEIATSYRLTSDLQVQAITYPESIQSIRHGIGDIVFDEHILEVSQQLFGGTKSSYQDSAHNIFTSHYHIGGTFTRGFIGILNMLFAEQGLLFVSSRVLRLMGLMQSVILRDAEHPNVTNLALEKGSAEVVRAGFHAQVQGAEVNFFFHDPRVGRIKVKQRTDKKYILGNTIVSHTELCTQIRTNPELFSSTVVIRPVIQDSLFPNLAYIAGPGELAYFAQFKEVYEAFNMTMPAILLRHTATILPQKLMQGLDAIGGWTSLLVPDNEREHLLNNYVRSTSAFLQLDEYKSSIMATLDTMKQHIVSGDSTLLSTMSGIEKRVMSAVEHGIHKAIKSTKRRDIAVVDRIRRAGAWVYPKNHLQERLLSVLWAIETFGVQGFTDILHQVVEHNSHMHTLVLF